MFYNENFSLTSTNLDTAYQKNIPLRPIAKDAFIILNNIFYDSKKYELKTESYAELNKIVQLLTINPTLKIEITGHTDNVGTPTSNLTLSNNRAKEVVKYFS